jgi:hypothetical protein
MLNILPVNKEIFSRELTGVNIFFKESVGRDGFNFLICRRLVICTWQQVVKQYVHENKILSGLFPRKINVAVSFSKPVFNNTALKGLSSEFLQGTNVTSFDRTRFKDVPLGLFLKFYSAAILYFS